MEHIVKGKSIYILDKHVIKNTFDIDLENKFNSVYAVILNKSRWEKINNNDVIAIEDNLSKISLKVINKVENQKNFWVFMEPEIFKYETK